MSHTLSNGREFVVDLSKVTVKEYNGLKMNTDKNNLAVLERITGIPAADFDTFTMNDMRFIVGSIIKIATVPIFDSKDLQNPS